MCNKQPNVPPSMETTRTVKRNKIKLECKIFPYWIRGVQFLECDTYKSIYYFILDNFACLTKHLDVTRCQKKMDLEIQIEIIGKITTGRYRESEREREVGWIKFWQKKKVLSSKFLSEHWTPTHSFLDS